MLVRGKQKNGCPADCERGAIDQAMYPTAGLKKVLMVAYYFPPIAVSGSVRPAAFCKYLPEFNWEPQVVTTDAERLDPPLAVDHGLSDGFSKSLIVKRIPHPNPNEALLRMRARFRKPISFLKRETSEGTRALSSGQPSPGSSQNKRSFVRKVLGRILEEFLLFPDLQRFWQGPVMHHFREISQEQYPDLIFATGGPWTSLLIGATLAERFKVPFVADFRDPWVDNPYWVAGSQKLSQRARELEQRVCEKATTVVLNTEELAEAFRKRYPTMAERFVTITNGFDRSILVPLSHSGQKTIPRRLRLSHFGTIYGKRSPELLFEAILELIQADSSLAPRLVLEFTGGWDIKSGRCENLARELEAIGVLARTDRISRDESLRRMAQSETLLILQPEAPLQIPAKIFEYIAMRRPLVVLGGEGATANLIQRHGLGVCCSNRPDSIKQLIHRLLKEEAALCVPEDDKILAFDYRSLTARLANVLSVAHQQGGKAHIASS